MGTESLEWDAEPSPPGFGLSPLWLTSLLLLRSLSRLSLTPEGHSRRQPAQLPPPHPPRPVTVLSPRQMQVGRGGLSRASSPLGLGASTGLWGSLHPCSIPAPMPGCAPIPSLLPNLAAQPGPETLGTLFPSVCLTTAPCWTHTSWKF